MDSIQVTIEAGVREQEILISELSDLGAQGFEQQDVLLIAYFNELEFNSTQVSELLSNHKFQINTIPAQNWNEVWESNFEPVVVGNFCGIRAGFHSEIKKVEHEIIITPKMSFGTGHHATTYMMIEQMHDMDLCDNRVFDFGTGTGILSILAEKMGASEITAIDIDEWSIENARENIQMNHCSRINLSLSSTVPPGDYDIVLANINRNVILDRLTPLKNSLRSKGCLLLSGLLVSDKNEVVESCRTAGFSLIKQKERDNWISLLLNRD